MTYNEWRDELKNNLLSVSESERRRVLDYYAEAYADRRDAGYSEWQIIQDFGAPYDAAQRILLNICDEPEEIVQETMPTKNKTKHVDAEPVKSAEPLKPVEPVYEEVKSANSTNNINSEQTVASNYYVKPAKKDNTWLFVVICIVFAIPIFSIVTAMASVSFAVVTAPFALVVAGIGSIVLGIIDCSSSIINGVFSIGEGLLVLGIGIVFIPLMIKLVKVMWTLLNKFFRWLKQVFSGKECAK